MLDYFVQHSAFIIPVTIFVVALTAIIFDLFDKALIAMTGAALLIVTRIMSFEETVQAINFEIIALLAAMMIIVEIAKESGFFSLMSFKLAKYSKGNPFLIFLFFTTITGIVSAFLDNVTVILIVVPITVALVRGLGYDPFVFVVTEIMFASIGGVLTLIGDPLNVLIGTAKGISFNSFLLHMSIPVFASMAFILVALYIVKWKELKPIHHDLSKLFLSNVLLKKIEYRHKKTRLNTRYIFTVVGILVLTILGFLLQSKIELPSSVIAMVGAFVLMFVVHKKINVEHVFSTIEWSTLAFFAGLFVIVAGLQTSGAIDVMANFMVNVTADFNLLILLILWGTAILSSVINNIPLATVMVPILFTITDHYSGVPNVDILWWALILGCAFGGNATMIGASANVVGVGVARKEGINITFLNYLKYSLPLTLGTLLISTAYLLIWANYF